MSLCLTGWDEFLNLEFGSSSEGDTDDNFQDIFELFINIIQEEIPAYVEVFWYYAENRSKPYQISIFPQVWENERVEILMNWLDNSLKECDLSEDLIQALCRIITNFLLETVQHFRTYKFDHFPSHYLVEHTLSQYSGASLTDARLILNFSGIILKRCPKLIHLSDHLLLNDIEMMNDASVIPEEFEMIRHGISDISQFKNVPNWCVKLAFMMAAYFEPIRLRQGLKCDNVRNLVEFREFLRRPILRYILLGLACGHNFFTIKTPEEK